MIKNDEEIILFNNLYNDCSILNQNIVKTYSNIYRNCNKGFSNLLSGTRVMINIHNNNYTNVLGFGSNGFGVAGYSRGTLNYGSHNLRSNKKTIIDNDYRFRAKVKKSSQYRDMFEITLNALKKVPDVNGITNTVNCNIEKLSYGETVKYKDITTESPFAMYSTGFTIKLLNASIHRGYYNYSLTSANVQQDVELRHIYGESSKLLKKHLKDMTLLYNILDRYEKGNEYKKLVDELTILEVTKTI